MLRWLFNYCGFNRDKKKKSMNSIRNIPDIKLESDINCHTCFIRIYNSTFMSAFKDQRFYFCTEQCYLKWLNNNPVLQYTFNT